MKTKTSTHKRNLLLLIGVVVLIFTLPSWYVGKEILPNENILDCSLCDATANGGVVSVPTETEGFTEDIGVFCNDAAVSLEVTNAILPNDTYQGIFMVTDEDQNIVAYADGGTNNTALIGSLPAGEYLAWHLVYTNTVFPALPAVGASAAALVAAGEEGEGCLVLSEPLEITIIVEIEVEILGFDCPEGNGNPIVQVTGGCPEITGFGSYAFSLNVEGFEEGTLNGGFVSGIYVEGVGMTTTILGSSPLFLPDGTPVSIMVTGDGCGCQSEISQEGFFCIF